MVGAVKVTGVEDVRRNLAALERQAPAKAAGAINAAVQIARRSVIRQLASQLGIPQRILRGTGATGKGGHIRRRKAKSRRLVGKLVGLVQGIRASRVSGRAAGRAPTNVGRDGVRRRFETRSRSGHRGLFSRFPVPSTRVGRGSAGTTRPNLPIKEVVIQLEPHASRLIQHHMKSASHKDYPRELWKRLRKTIK